MSKELVKQIPLGNEGKYYKFPRTSVTLYRRKVQHHGAFFNHLPRVFVQLTGPWRSLWVRFGYDPRKHPEAKIYQVLDFRIRCGMKYGKRAQPTELLSLLSG